MDNYLILQNVTVTDMKMDSSPITRGFPSVTAIMGMVHALERKLQDNHGPIKLPKAAISCHHFDKQRLHATKEGIIPSQSKKPPYQRGLCGKLSVPFIDDARADMRFSLIMEIKADEIDILALTDEVANLLPHLRLAGGTLWNKGKIHTFSCSKDDGKGQKALLRRLMPGFVLMERKDLVEEAMTEGADALDAILDYLEVSRTDNKEKSPAWTKKMKVPGWLVPIAVGYRALTEAGYVKGQRDPQYKHCFAENVLTLGEFVMSYQFDMVDEILWESEIQEDQGLYIFTQNN